MQLAQGSSLLIALGLMRDWVNEGSCPMELVRYSVLNDVAEIVLDRGPVNALNLELIEALLANLDKDAQTAFHMGLLSEIVERCCTDTCS